VVLDATFTQAPLRARAQAVAREQGVAFHGVWLEAPAAVLEARVAQRAGDASDATVETLHRQLAADVGPLTWRRVDASGPVEASAEAWSAGHG
jgi:hypothetical protein